MSLFEQVATASRPNKFNALKMYTFSKGAAPHNKSELEKADIETVLATSFDDCFRQRPELNTYYLISITS